MNNNAQSSNRKWVKTLIMRLLKLVHFLIIIGAFVGCWILFYHQNVNTEIQLRFSILMCGFNAAISAFLIHVYHAYDIGFTKVSEIIYALSLSNVLSAAIIYFLYCLAWLKFANPLPLLGLILAQLLINVGWAFIANKVYFRIHHSQKAVIIYRNVNDLERVLELKKFINKFDIDKQIENPSDNLDTLFKQIDGYETIIVAGIPATLRNALAKYCVDNGIRGYFAPHVGDIIMMGAKSVPQFHVPILSVRRKTLMPEYMLVKRLFDIVCSLLGIIVFSPAMLICAILIKAYDHGPVLYKQVRLTKDKKEFKIWKFRSMKVDAEKDGVARLSSGDKDNRITPIGRVMRKVRLDELPQLFNILFGQMTIVGPRPERPEIAKQYEEVIPAFSMRLQVKAGLTGYAQIYGKYNSTPYDKLQMDLMYINNMSIFEDLKLIFATIKILFLPESTEGISSEQITAMNYETNSETSKRTEWIN